MGYSEIFYYYEDSVGLSLRQKYVNFEAFVNQFYLENQISKHGRNVLLFDKNFAIGILKLKNDKGKIHLPVKYVYSSSQIHSKNERYALAGGIHKTRKHLVKLLEQFDSGFSLSPTVTTAFFTPLSVNSENIINGVGAFIRRYDTEYKILEEFSSSIDEHISLGKLTGNYSIEVDIYTRLQPCESCKDVATQFNSKHNNSRIRFYFEREY